CDARDFPDFFSPRDLQEKIETIDDMRFDLEPLVRIETPFWDRKEADFFARQYRALDATRIAVSLARDFEQAIEFSRRQKGWLVRHKDGTERILEFGPAQAVFLLE